MRRRIQKSCLRVIVGKKQTPETFTTEAQRHRELQQQKILKFSVGRISVPCSFF